jgi:uncharacterized membrane protein
MASHFKSIAKAITWRVLGAADTFVLSFFVTGKATAAVGIVGFELLTKSVLYYGHERAWEIFWLPDPSRGDALARSATRYLTPVFNRKPYSGFVAMVRVTQRGLPSPFFVFAMRARRLD